MEILNILVLMNMIMILNYHKNILNIIQINKINADKTLFDHYFFTKQYVKSKININYQEIKHININLQYQFYSGIDYDISFFNNLEYLSISLILL